MGLLPLRLIPTLCGCDLNLPKLLLEGIHEPTTNDETILLPPIPILPFGWFEYTGLLPIRLIPTL
jgi:hypothetical protein